MRLSCPVLPTKPSAPKHPTRVRALGGLLAAVVDDIAALRTLSGRSYRDAFFYLAPRKFPSASLNL
jgi:hypothetical protein